MQILSSDSTATPTQGYHDLALELFVSPSRPTTPTRDKLLLRPKLSLASLYSGHAPRPGLTEPTRFVRAGDEHRLPPQKESAYTKLP
jgi:hypothetical protein